MRTNRRLAQRHWRFLEQELATEWNNGSSGLATAWITFDLGATRAISTLMLAPRGDRAYNLDLIVSETLDGGQAAGDVNSICSFAGAAARQPDALSECVFSDNPTGRYLTVRSRNISRLTLYGTEIWGL